MIYLRFSDGCDIVRCGFWINWIDGKVNGSTLTLPTELGLILTAFMALFIKLAGGYMWGIVCFILHQYRASAALEDDTHHQLQVTLRNTDNETSFLWSLCKVAFAHNGARLKAYRRSFWLILLAIAHGVSFSIAGGLSSRFIVSSNEVQLLAGKCGWIPDNVDVDELKDDAVFKQANALIVAARNGYQRSATYARSCYAHREGQRAACGAYMKAALPYRSDSNAACPFSKQICNTSALHMDTEPLRSDEHFGFNTRSEDAILLRKQLTCAPLNGEQYTDGWISVNQSVFFPPGSEYIGYKFGPSPGEFPPYTIHLTRRWLEYGDSKYAMASSSYFLNYTGDKATPFDPIAELKPTDADLSLVYLACRAIFRRPVADPFINAQRCNVTSKGPLAGVNICQATNPLSFMGCNERYQLCNSDSSVCTPFTGLYALQQTPASFNPTQSALYKILWELAWVGQLNLQIGLFGRENLIANDYLWDTSFNFGMSAELPPDHWHDEVANWMNTSLSAMQRAAPAFARPVEADGSTANSIEYIEEPADPTTRLLCHKVKMRSTEFTSFSVLAIFLTLAIGLLIMIFSAALPALVAAWQQRTGHGGYKRLDWVEGNALQLQRMAAEGRGIGPWEGKDADVPMLADRGARFNLANLSLRDGAKVDGQYGYRGLAGEEAWEAEGVEMMRFRGEGGTRSRERSV